MSTSAQGRSSNTSGIVLAVPPATCGQHGRANPAMLNAQIPREGLCQATAQGEIRTCYLPVADDNSRQLAEDIANIAGEDPNQIQIIIDPTYPEWKMPVQTMTEPEAIERLRALNSNPGCMHRRRLRALKRVEKKLANRKLKMAPIRHIAAGLFADLDVGLFDGQLFWWVCIGQSNYLEGAARTDPLCACGVRITLSERYYDQQLKNESPDVRIWDALTSLIHEMCHAYIRVQCGWSQPDDVEYCGSRTREGHGIYFGQVARLVQKVVDYLDWDVDLSDKGRYPMYALRRVNG